MEITILDYLVFFIFVGGVALFGCSFYFRSRKGAAAFTAAEGSLPTWVVGMSIFATFVSSISFLGLPGDAYKGNWNPFVFSLSIPIATWLAAKVFIPLYRGINSVSAYHYLEMRFGYWARCYVAVCYLLTQLARVGSILLLLALPLNTMFGWDIQTIIVCTGIATLIYTLLGGIAAVVWTDAIQGIILIVGAIACAAILTFTMPEGPGQLFEIASAHGKFSLGSFGASLTEPTFWVVLIYGLFVNMQNYGIDQNYVQRYMTTRSTAEAVKSTLFGGLLYIPVSLVFVYIGTALFSYYTARPELLPAGTPSDQVFPWFIVHGLPTGLTGLVIASLFSAGMSTIATSINSSATIVLTDFAKRLSKKELSEKKSMRVLYATSFVVGALGIVMGLLMMRIDGVLDAWWKLASRHARTVPAGRRLQDRAPGPRGRRRDPRTADHRLDEPLAAHQRRFALLPVPQPAAHLPDDRLRNDGHLPDGLPAYEAHEPQSRKRMKTRLKTGLLLCGGVLGGSAAVAAQKQPNILLVLSDDQSAFAVGCYGNADIRTPNLDRFAAEGVRFNRAYATSPQSVPSRASIMTGRSPVAVNMTRFNVTLARRFRAFPEYLRENGYYTGVAGRGYHLDGAVSGRVGKIKEVELYYAEHGYKTFPDRLDTCMVVADASRGKNHGKINAQFRTFMERRDKDKPFFLQLCYSDPHTPYDAPKVHDPRSLTLPPFYPDTQLVREYLAAYYDEIHRMDSDFGEVLRYLDDHGLSDDTIVIFMGDNGGAQFMAKGTLYENGIRVPFLVRWPGRIAPAVTDAVVSNVDIASTCLAAAGLPVPEEMEGADLLPLMVQGETPAERWVYSVRSCHATNSLPGKTSVFDQMRCIVGERYKLIYNLLPGLPWVPVDFSGTEMFAELKRMHKSGELDTLSSRLYFSPTRPMFELYDLRNDPCEQHNLIDDPALKEIRNDLILKLTYKMIEDEDFVTLPHPKIYE